MRLLEQSRYAKIGIVRLGKTDRETSESCNKRRLCDKTCETMPL